MDYKLDHVICGLFASIRCHYLAPGAVQAFGQRLGLGRRSGASTGRGRRGRRGGRGRRGTGARGRWRIRFRRLQNLHTMKLLIERIETKWSGRGNQHFVINNHKQSQEQRITEMHPTSCSGTCGEMVMDLERVRASIQNNPYIKSTLSINFQLVNLDGIGTLGQVVIARAHEVILKFASGPVCRVSIGDFLKRYLHWSWEYNWTILCILSVINDHQSSVINVHELPINDNQR